MKNNYSLPIFLLVVLALCSYCQTGDAQDLNKLDIDLLDGTSLSASIDSISPEGVVSGEGIPAGLTLSEIVSITTTRSTNETRPKNNQVVLIGGGQIFVSSPVVSNETVSFESSCGIRTLPLQSIRAIVWTNSDGATKSIHSPSNEKDRIFVQTKDSEAMREGILEKVDAEQVHLNYKGETRTLGVAKVNAVVMADLGLPLPEGSPANVQLMDGSKLVGVISSLAGNSLKLNLAGAGTVEIEANRVSSISIVSDRLVYLSDLEPVSVEEKSIFAIQLTWQRDQSVGQNKLAIRHADGENVSYFNKGIGAQSYARLLFNNEREFDRFAAVAGIDAETGGTGDCRMVVVGDGIELWSKRVTASDGPQKVDLSIEGLKQISLIVYPGEQFDLGDHADWCNARFLKTR